MAMNNLASFFAWAAVCWSAWTYVIIPVSLPWICCAGIVPERDEQTCIFNPSRGVAK